MNAADGKFLPAGWASPLHSDDISDAGFAKYMPTKCGCLLFHTVHTNGTSQLRFLEVRHVLAA